MKRSPAAILLFLAMPLVLWGQSLQPLPVSGPQAVIAGAPAPTYVGMSVQVEKTAVRLLPSVTGAVLGFLGYGTRVSVGETVSGWSKIAVVESPGYGWIRASALTTKRIESKSAAPAGSGVSGSETALAGRGFNGSVEDLYRSAAHLDYTWIDAMESFGVAEDESLAFLEALAPSPEPGTGK